MTAGRVISLFRRGDAVPQDWFTFVSSNPEHSPLVTATFNAPASAELIDGVRYVHQLRHTAIGVPFVYFNIPVNDPEYEGGTIAFTCQTEFYGLYDPEPVGDSYI